MSNVGLEIFYNSIKGAIRSKSDSLVGLCHWFMLKDRYVCIGLGDQDVETDYESECLPDGWNAQQTVYCIRYKKLSDSSKFLLKIVLINRQLHLSLMRFSDGVAFSTTISTEEYCTSQLENHKSAFTNIDNLQSKLRTDVLNAFKTGAAVGPSTENRQSSTPQPSSPTRSNVPPMRTGQPPLGPRQPHPQFPSIDPFSVGRADLDPLSGGAGGGMFMDPQRTGFPRLDPLEGDRRNNRIPRGSVPPGAHYDPIGPPGFRNRPGPDPDHERPPDWDDMYM